MTHGITCKLKTVWVISCLFLTVFATIPESLAIGVFPGSGVRDPELFSRCWDFKVTPNLAVTPVLDSSVVYFVDVENKLLALDLVGAGRVWSSELGGEVVSNLLLSDPSLLLVTNSQVVDSTSAPKTFLRSVSRATGITEWRVEIKSSTGLWIGAYPNLIAAVGESGLVSAFSRNDGKLVWERELGATVTTSPMFGTKGIALGTEAKDIFEVALTDGSLRPLWKSDYLPTALTMDTAGRLVVGDERGNVTAIAANGDRSWTFRNGARISSVLVDDSDYLASSNDNFVYRLTRGGNVKWKRRLPGRLAQAPLLLDDVAVMSVSGGGGVFVLDVNKGKILDRIQAAEDLSFAVGSSASNLKNFFLAGPAGVSYFSREKCSSK